jgi:hypothetical protein
MQHACAYVVLLVVFFCAFAALSSIFLALIETSIAWYVATRLEGQLNGGKFQNFRGTWYLVPTSSECLPHPTKERRSTWQGTSFTYMKCDKSDIE